MGTPVKVRFQEAEERPKLLEELGQRLQHYAKIAADFRGKVGAAVTPRVTWTWLTCDLSISSLINVE